MNVRNCLIKENEVRYIEERKKKEEKNKEKRNERSRDLMCISEQNRDYIEFTEWNFSSILLFGAQPPSPGW